MRYLKDFGSILSYKPKFDSKEAVLGMKNPSKSHSVVSYQFSDKKTLRDVFDEPENATHLKVEKPN